MSSSRLMDTCEAMEIEEAGEEEEEEEEEEADLLFRVDLRKRGVVVKRVIGKGSGNVTVYLAEIGGKRVAVKRFDLRHSFTEDARHMILEEARVMKDLHQSERFLFLSDVHDASPAHISFVMDFCEGGDLLSHIQTYGTFGDSDAKKVVRQLLEALAIMHAKDMCHRDVKLENVLLVSRENLSIKLADMGTAARSLSKRRTTFKGTLATMAPEIKQRMCPKGGPSMSNRPLSSSLTAKETYDGQRADMFSVGVVIYCMLKGAYPRGTLRGIALDVSMSLDA